MPHTHFKMLEANKEPQKTKFIYNTITNPDTNLKYIQPQEYGIWDLQYFVGQPLKFFSAGQ